MPANFLFQGWDGQEASRVSHWPFDPINDSSVALVKDLFSPFPPEIVTMMLTIKGSMNDHPDS